MAGPAPFDTAVTDELLATTRAVRKRLDLTRPVPRQTIDQCLEMAVQAPTASNRQSWRWVVVDDADKRAAIADEYRAAMADRLGHANPMPAPPDDAQTARVLDSAGWLAQRLQDVPVFVIPCVEGRLEGGEPLGHLAAVFGSILPAVWSFQLALRSRGLGSCFTTVHLFRERQVAEILGIPGNVMQAALLPVAWTVGTDFKRAKRPPVSEITHWNEW